MDTSNLVASLVDTYKELNMKYRTLEGNAEVMNIVKRMRNDEVQFSKALKDRLTGIGTATEDMTDEAEIVEGSDENIAQVISQFGSARATTLNLLKGIEDNSVWQNNLDDGTTIGQRVEELATSDKNQLQRLADVTGI